MSWEDLEALYWRFDAMHKGYGEWSGRPTSERDAFKRTVKQALAEKDWEIVYLQSERLSAAAMGDQRDRDYHTLMRQAVTFAEDLVVHAKMPLDGDEAKAFLSSPEVQAWREQEEGL